MYGMGVWLPYHHLIEAPNHAASFASCARGMQLRSKGWKSRLASIPKQDR